MHFLKTKMYSYEYHSGIKGQEIALKQNYYLIYKPFMALLYLYFSMHIKDRSFKKNRKAVVIPKINERHSSNILSVFKCPQCLIIY